jgi:hypothetical protein
VAISAITSDRSREAAEPADGGRSSGPVGPVGKWRRGEHLHAVRADGVRLRAVGAAAARAAAAAVAISGNQWRP